MMPDTRKLALEVEAQSAKALEELAKLKGLMKEVNKAAEESVKTDKRAQAQQKQATANHKALTEAQLMSGRAMTMTTSNLEGMIGTMGKGDGAMQKLISSGTGVISTFLTMGPQAGAMQAAFTAVQLGVEALVNWIDELNQRRIDEALIEGTYRFAGGIQEIETQAQLAKTRLGELRSENRELMADLEQADNLWNKLGFQIKHFGGVAFWGASAHDRAAKQIIKNTEEISRKQEVLAGTQAAFNQQINEGIILEQESADAAINLVNQRVKQEKITKDVAIAQYELILATEKYVNELTPLEIAAIQERIEALQREVDRTAKVGRSIYEKRIELEKQLRDEILQLTTDVYEYKLAKLREDYTEHVKLVRDKELLERWFTEQELAIYAEQYEAEMRLAEQSLIELERLVDSKLAIQERLNTDLMRMSMDSTEFAIMQIEAQAEAYREAGSDVLDVELWKFGKIAEIQERAAEEAIRRAHATASQFTADARAMFSLMGQAFQETLDWQTTMEEQYGAKSKDIAEIRKKALQAAAWEQVKESIKAMAWEQLQKAAAFAIAGLWVKAGQHAAVAAALGAGAAMAGHLAATRRGEVETMQTAFERQQEALAREREAREEAEERAIEPTAPGGRREEGPRITHSTLYFNFDITSHIHGNVFGLTDIETYFLGLFKKIAARGKLDWLRNI